MEMHQRLLVPTSQGTVRFLQSLDSVCIIVSFLLIHMYTHFIHIQGNGSAGSLNVTIFSCTR